ncbi:M9 family metallopeptidase [Aliivibrio kagoshimensis]|uniref:M9 family metallopeptidase n=1 Tax=Aliivibrio kagoshimensis TaxID=2910230 RepID=UPI003D13E27F
MEFNKVGLAIAATVLSYQIQAASPPQQEVMEVPIIGHGVEHSHDQAIPKKLSNIQPVNVLTSEDSKTPTIQFFGGEPQAAPQPCDPAVFATSSSTELLNQIKSLGSNCVNELFGASNSIQSSAFTSSNIYNVAKHVTNLSRNYQGNGDKDIEAIFLYLRAGYYAEFYNTSVSFSSWVQPSVKESIDAFLNNVHFYDNNDNHGKVLTEVITTMDSAGLQNIYLPVVKEWLKKWNANYATSWNMRNAVNGIFTIIFNGQWNNDFVATIKNDQELVTLLKNFALNRYMIDSDSEFMIANAGRELGRLKMYTNAAIQPNVDSALKELFSTYQSFGYGDAIWLGAAENATYYEDCSTFGICGYRENVRIHALTQEHVCSPTIKIISQNLTATQQIAACDKMGFEENYFHTKLDTSSGPVKDDHNDQLQVNIFDSSNDYGKYAAAIFDIDTNNGGMYLEGDPSVPGNIPNFVAYEANYANPDHYIWNLEHEYVHYLDGRFDLYGNFNTPTELVVWWSEGVAEYVANQDDNPLAIETILDGSTYTLAQIFDTTYEGFDVDRIYRWGYLAVRFMFERHIDDINLMLAATRSGDWAAYKSIITQWSTQYQSEFEQWLKKVAAGTTLPKNCSTSSKINSGTLEDGIAACLASSNTIWLNLANVNAQQNIAISTGEGTGDLTIEYSNSGWPNGTNVDARSNNPGNSECIYLNAQPNYWGYIKVSGAAENAAIAIDYNVSGCRK